MVDNNDWRALSDKDVRGRDLTWRTAEGIDVKPHYTAEDVTHVGVATPSIAEAVPFYRDVMGATGIGAHGMPIFFVHPRDMAGALTEIMETPRDGH